MSVEPSIASAPLVPSEYTEAPSCSPVRLIPVPSFGTSDLSLSPSFVTHTTSAFVPLGLVRLLALVSVEGEIASATGLPNRGFRSPS